MCCYCMIQIKAWEKLKFITIFVHLETQYPLSFHSFNPGGRAILSVYSRPISITPASYFRSLSVIKNVIPELSINPENIK